MKKKLNSVRRSHSRIKYGETLSYALCACTLHTWTFLEAEPTFLEAEPTFDFHRQWVRHVSDAHCVQVNSSHKICTTLL